MATVDLNADMGESYGPWKMGNDDILLDIVTSANIACGFHAGDPNIMLSTMKMAAEKDVGIGAHPGFHDIEGFGRNRLSIPIGTLQNQVRYQVGAALGMARAAGTTVRHIKLHGAMSNMASEDAYMAYALYDAALSVAPEATIMVLAATAHQEAAEKLGCKWVGEIFADRAYNDDATLVDRRLPGAVIHDAAIAGAALPTWLKPVQSSPNLGNISRRKSTLSAYMGIRPRPLKLQNQRDRHCVIVGFGWKNSPFKTRVWNICVFLTKKLSRRCRLFS